MVVDYMCRYVDSKNKEDSFFISISGARILDMESKAIELLDNIDGINEKSIISARKLVGFDCVYRAGPMTYKPIEEINPNEHTIFNIITMINRANNFYQKNDLIVASGMVFPGAYTKTVVAGDADLMTKDTIWDIKVSKNSLKTFQTLQVLMYYLMGCKSDILNDKYDFKNSIRKIGVYNPRLNIAYTKDVNKIEDVVINDVLENVLCYDNKQNLVNNDHLLTVTDLMRLFSISRYTIMKYYSEYDLPLKK